MRSLGSWWVDGWTWAHIVKLVNGGRSSFALQLYSHWGTKARSMRWAAGEFRRTGRRLGHREPEGPTTNCSPRGAGQGEQSRPGHSHHVSHRLVKPLTRRPVHGEARRWGLQDKVRVSTAQTQMRSLLSLFCGCITVCHVFTTWQAPQFTSPESH